jgi:signal peptidase I
VLAIARAAISVGPLARRPGCARVALDVAIVAGLIALFLITFVTRTFYIPSVSMVPTLQIGDVLLVDEVAYRLRPPGEGDIAVFTPPVGSIHSDFVKRVIGTPGDAIAINDGVVYRNGTALREPYENQPPSYDLAIRKYGIYVNGNALDTNSAKIPAPGLWQAPDRIPAGFYFVLGDNRNYSDDSHVWGFVGRSAFVGRAFLILWPLDRLHALEK